MIEEYLSEMIKKRLKSYKREGEYLMEEENQMSSLIYALKAIVIYKFKKF
jgi:hypothetical protein